MSSRTLAVTMVLCLAIFGCNHKQHPVAPTDLVPDVSQDVNLKLPDSFVNRTYVEGLASGDAGPSLAIGKVLECNAQKECTTVGSIMKSNSQVFMASSNRVVYKSIITKGFSTNVSYLAAVAAGLSNDEVASVTVADKSTATIVGDYMKDAESYKQQNRNTGKMERIWVYNATLTSVDKEICRSISGSVDVSAGVFKINGKVYKKKEAASNDDVVSIVWMHLDGPYNLMNKVDHVTSVSAQLAAIASLGQPETRKERKPQFVLLKNTSPNNPLFKPDQYRGGITIKMVDKESLLQEK